MVIGCRDAYYGVIAGSDEAGRECSVAVKRHADGARLHRNDPRTCLIIGLLGFNNDMFHGSRSTRKKRDTRAATRTAAGGGLRLRLPAPCVAGRTVYAAVVCG